MALKFLSNHTPGGSASSSKDVKVFEIRLDNDYIVLRGGEEEAASAPLSGSVVLCLADAFMIHHVKLTLSGIVHMSYFAPSASAISGRRIAYKEKSFFEKQWIFKDAGKGRSEVLPSDNYEWPFDVILDGSLPESIEGARDSWVVYRFKAEICRKRGKDIVVRKPLRVVRTLGPTALELSHAMSVENVWPNKLEYSISTPNKAVVFGSFVRVDFKFISLLKGLVIGTISTQLKEDQEFVVDPEWNLAVANGGVMREDRVIVYDNYTLKEADESIIEEQAEGYAFSRFLELPKSLNNCLQDCNVKGIKVRHKLKFNVQLHNPDGHVSELRANLPVVLYISPSLPINENNDLVDQTPQAGRAAIANDIAHAAPPVYGQHTLDQIYSEVDLNGYRTPEAALSSSGTPYSQSRNISSENVARIDAITNSPDHVSAAALQSRLQNLRTSERISASPLAYDDHEQLHSGQISRRSSQIIANGDYFSADSGRRDSVEALPNRPSPFGSPGPVQNSETLSPSGSAQMSRSGSAEDTQPTPAARRSPAILDQLNDLVKVPSYSTAMKTPAPKNTWASDALPSYRAVLSESQPGTPAEPPSTRTYPTRSGSWSGDIPDAAAIGAADVFGHGRPSRVYMSSIADPRRRRSLVGRG